MPRFIRTLGSLGLPLLSVMLGACGLLNAGTELNVGNIQVFYKAPTTADEAMRMAEFLKDNGWGEDNEVTVQLTRQGETYEVHVVVKKGIEQDPEYIASFKLLGDELSSEVFGDAKVDVHLADDYLNTIRVVPCGSC